MTPAPHSPDCSDEPLRSVHTTSLPVLLDDLHSSLIVSTYQAGKLILARNQGGVLNTHFRVFARPMGIAVDGGRLAVGGARAVWHYRNQPAVAGTLDPAGTHDACFVPHRQHITGAIDIHEMAFAADGALWAVNTRFNCLCTFDDETSFVPRWRPSFVSAWAPEDRCHLNGLAMVDGRPTYVTALGTTDQAGAWRQNKNGGGVLIDVETNQVLLRGLSMPHSPRVYGGALWLLESGRGTLVRADLASGTWQTVAELPGFTRGLDFAGPFAFVGVSQVREKATFSDIPVLQRCPERTCGVWVVHLPTGQVVGFLRFEAGVQEIFAVQVLTGRRFPEVLDTTDERAAQAYVLPDAALTEVAWPSVAA